MLWSVVHSRIWSCYNFLLKSLRGLIEVFGIEGKSVSRLCPYFQWCSGQEKGRGSICLKGGKKYLGECDMDSLTWLWIQAGAFIIATLHLASVWVLCLLVPHSKWEKKGVPHIWVGVRYFCKLFSTLLKWILYVHEEFHLFQSKKGF